MPFHADALPEDVHVFHHFVFANAAARAAATGYLLALADLGKVAYQADTNSFWVLLDDSPITWSELTLTSALTADLNLGTHKITSLATPTTGTDAATKAYVDAAVLGLPSGSVDTADLATGAVTVAKMTFDADVNLAGHNLVVPTAGVVAGGTTASTNLILSSSLHATKGFVYFGSSTGLVYDETNKRLGIGGAPSFDLHLTSSNSTTSARVANFLTTGSALLGLTAGTGQLLLSAYGSSYAGNPAFGLAGANNLFLTSVGHVSFGTVGATDIYLASNNTIRASILSTGEFIHYTTVAGGTSASANLTLVSTTNATKGFVYLGSSTGLVYDETNKRLGIGGTPAANIHVQATFPVIKGSGSSTTGGATLWLLNDNSLGQFQAIAYGSAAAGTSFGVSNAGLVTAYSVGPLAVGASGADYVILGTNNLERARILSTGEFIHGTVVAGGTTTGLTLILKGTTFGDGTVIVSGANTVSTSPVLQIESTSASGYAVISLRSNAAERGGLRSDFGGTTRLYSTGALELGAGGNATTPSLKVLSTGETIIQIGLYGGAGASGTITIGSTTNATKGFVYFGSSTGLVYDETNKRLGIGIAPTSTLHLSATNPEALFKSTSTSQASDIQLQNSTSSANLLLSVYGSAVVATQFGVTLGSAAAVFSTAGTAPLLVGSLVASDLVFGTNNVERARILSTGEFIHATTTYGGTTSAANQTLASTTHATKGFVYLGSSTGLVYDETNKYLGLGVAPSAELHISKSASISAIFQSTSGAATFQIKSGGAGNNAQLLFEISAGQDWMLGNKQTDGTFRISNSTTLGTSDLFSVSSAASGNATLSSTSHATKGFVYLGSSTGLVYDETNKRLGLGITPAVNLDVGPGTGGHAFANLTNSGSGAQSALGVYNLAQTSGVALTSRSTSGTLGGVASAGTGLVATGAVGALVLGAAGAVDVVISSNNVERLRVSSAGVVSLKDPSTGVSVPLHNGWDQVERGLAIARAGLNPRLAEFWATSVAVPTGSSGGNQYVSQIIGAGGTVTISANDGGKATLGTGTTASVEVIFFNGNFFVTNCKTKKWYVYSRAQITTATTAQSEIWVVQLYGGTGAPVGLVVINGVLTLRTVDAGTTDVTTTWTVDTAAAHHFAVSFDGTTLTAWVDDVNVGSTAVLTNLQTQTGEWATRCKNGTDTVNRGLVVYSGLMGVENP